MKLTDMQVQRLPIPEQGQKTYFEGNGFGVRVSCGGTKTFVQVYGKKRQMKTLGRYPAVSLKIARQEAQKFLVTLSPHTTKKSVTEALTAFYEYSERKNRPATTANYRMFLSRITKTKLEDISITDVTNTSHGIMAAKVFMNFCMRNGWVDRNPFQFEKCTYGKRSRLLTDEEIKAIWHYDHPPFSDHLKLLILTGQRRNQFSNCEIRGNAIFFPASVMKGGRDHMIPLGGMAKEILERLKPTNSWSKNKAKLDKAVPLPHYTIHDIRKYFSTTMAKLKVPLPVTERILDHRSGQVSGVAALYNLHDFFEEAREAVDKFENHIKSVVL